MTYTVFKKSQDFDNPMTSQLFNLLKPLIERVLKIFTNKLSKTTCKNKIVLIYFQVNIFVLLNLVIVLAIKNILDRVVTYLELFMWFLIYTRQFRKQKTSASEVAFEFVLLVS